MERRENVGGHTVPPLRFPRRSLFWFVVIFLGFVLALPVLPLLGSFLFVIEPPLQRYYLLAYVESARDCEQSLAQPPRLFGYTRLPPAGNVLSSPSRDVQCSRTVEHRRSPFARSVEQTAGQGSRPVPRERVNSAELQAFLRGEHL